MGRKAEPFTLVHRQGSPFWYYKLGAWDTYKTTGEKAKAEALKVALTALKELGSGPVGPTFRTYAAPFFIWERCPHVRRLTSEGKSINRYHVKDMRSLLENHVLSDPVAKLRITEIKRADILDFRERLVEKMGYTRTVQKAVSVLKIVLKEAFFWEELNRDPTAGVGVTKYQAAEIGTFTAEELRTLFPPKPPGAWKDLTGYAVFLTAATTGLNGQLKRYGGDT